MAKAKRKTLPKNFQELIDAGDIAALKAVFDTCEITAYEGYNKENALHFYDVPAELVRWLAEQGLDVDTPDATYGKTPLWKHASVGSDLVSVLLKLGADANQADKYGDTPLHMAAESHPETVKKLIAGGADVHAQNEYNQTPLAFSLSRCRGINIAAVVEVAEILLGAGDKITDEMRESVARIGKDFEFHRENFNKDYLSETEAGLAKLYELFGVKAVAKRVVHDGASPITVAAGSWQEQHNALWEYLVPPQGAAKTVQGEVVRITGRLSHEILGNGACNWNADFRKMCDALLGFFASGTPLSAADLEEAAELVKIIRPKGDGDAEPARLCELAVRWVARNTQPVALERPDYKR
jgi:hypothetical protein